MTDHQDTTENVTGTDAGEDTAVATSPRRTRVKPAPQTLSEASPFFEEDEYSLEDYEEMLGMYEETLSNIEEGEIVKAKILRITENAVILDVGFKSEGAITKDEFKNPESLKPGDEVEVFLENLEDQDGVVVLSKKKADFLRVWEKIKTAYEENEKVPGVLTRKIKGGVTVDLMGVDAFLPGSQIALRRVPNIEDLIGQTFDFKIIKLNKRRRNIVVSRRVILEEEREGKREQLVKELLVGQVRKGVVKNVTDFGAFIDLGGLDGLLHITDMSWGRVGHPSEIVQIGDELDVKVLDIDWNRERISLGLKQLLPYPWKDIERKYPVGVRVRGKVVSITNYGAFVELEKGVEGLVHISEMSWTRNVKHPSKLVNIGDEIEAVVLKVDRDDEKISLGMKQIEEDPWLALPEKYPVGTRVEGKVRNLTSFGAFVEIEAGIDGLIHISDMSWTKRVQHPSEILRKSDDVSVLVLGVDPENKRISLGLKQTQDDPWDDLATQYAQGVEKTGHVVRLLEDGVVVDLGDDVEGFIPRSQLDIPASEDAGAYVRDGMSLDVRVIEFDGANRRIVLTPTVTLERLPDEPATPAPAAEGEEGAPDADPDTTGATADAGEAASGEVEAPQAVADAPAAEAEAEATAEAPAADAGSEADAPVEAEPTAAPAEAETPAEEGAEVEDRT
ncbi:MAG TPA: 30S ribosomal protein S1 [Longimicrobiales bacterium]|nr:30S ribosomal protein S1 [Longimicrobiales bacterium]